MLLAALLVILAALMINGVLLIVDLFSDEETAHRGQEDQTAAVAEIQSTEAETETESETEVIVEEEKIRVILDAGHGGNDGGTSSSNLIEKNVNLDIALRMKPLLEEKGLEVVMTRETDEYVGLDERAYLANQTGGDLFLSIHCNYYKKGSTISGVECYYYSKAEEGKECAETLISCLKESGKVAARNAKAEDYYVLKNTSMTAVLIEVGYLSSKTDCLNLGSSKYKQTMAEELAEGVWTYLEAQKETEESES